MMSMDEVVKVVAVGVGATAVMDVWTMILKRLGVPTLDYAMVGRLAGHLSQGRFAHASIGKAAPIHGERPLGWAIHYAVGIAFAFLLITVQGADWLHDPTWMPALAVGVATVVIPLFVLQPAMGAGFAASRTPTPAKNCLRSLMTHGVFGSGLYVSGVVIRQWWA